MAEIAWMPLRANSTMFFSSPGGKGPASPVVPELNTLVNSGEKVKRLKGKNLHF
jgi:hypothetical protein